MNLLTHVETLDVERTRICSSRQKWKAALEEGQKRKKNRQLWSRNATDDSFVCHNFDVNNITTITRKMCMSMEEMLVFYKDIVRETKEKQQFDRLSITRSTFSWRYKSLLFSPS